MVRHSYMAVEFQLRWDSNKRNTILLWLRSMRRKIWIPLHTPSTTSTTKFITKTSTTTTTIKRRSPNSKHLLRVPRYSIQTLLMAITSSKKLTPSMICIIPIGSWDHLDRIYFCSIFPTTWRIHSCTTCLEDLEIYIPQELWRKRTASPKESDLWVSTTLNQPNRLSSKWTASKWEGSDWKSS